MLTGGILVVLVAAASAGTEGTNQGTAVKGGSGGLRGGGDYSDGADDDDTGLLTPEDTAQLVQEKYTTQHGQGISMARPQPAWLFFIFFFSLWNGAMAFILCMGPFQSLRDRDIPGALAGAAMRCLLPHVIVGLVMPFVIGGPILCLLCLWPYWVQCATVCGFIAPIVINTEQGEEENEGREQVIQTPVGPLGPLAGGAPAPPPPPPAPVVASVVNDHTNLPSQLSRTFSKPLDSMPSFRSFSRIDALPAPSAQAPQSDGVQYASQGKGVAVCCCCIGLAVLVALGPSLLGSGAIRF